jgi:hypothetical protein
MPVYETYASRVAAAAKAGTPDVYIYDDLPPFLRKQISQIFTECIGPGWRQEGKKEWNDEWGIPNNGNEIWEQIARIMDREREAFSLPQRDVYAYEYCMEYLRKSTDINEVLSLIEICAVKMMKLADEYGQWGATRRGATADPAEGLIQLNARFRQHGVGYQLENGKIIRIDSQYVHAEVVKEALRLLHEPDFDEANTEFMKAHRYLREGSGSLKDCNTAALRAMENVLKVICSARGWTYQKGDTFERLLAIVQGKGLFPDYLLEDGYFRNLIGAMKAGAPKIRNRQGGHGAAPGDEPVPDHMAAFALHLTAANIVMLVKAYRALPSMPT